MKTNRLIAVLCTAFALIGSTGNVHAQKLILLFAHGLYDAPAGNSNFRNNYTSGLGAEAGVGIGTGRTFLTGTVGYTSFRSVSNTSYGNMSYVPLKIGLRHYLLVGKILFFHVDLGDGIIKNSLVNGSRFTGDAGLGVKLGPIEILGDYDGFAGSFNESSGYSSWIGIKAGVHFGL